jgi:hypothetical protein
LKRKHSELIAEAFAEFIAAFLPPEVVQADNRKEFKGALLILLRKCRIQVINMAPRSPQTQGLVKQANSVVENKLRAWKIDHVSTKWADGLLEVTITINTQLLVVRQLSYSFESVHYISTSLIARNARISLFEFLKKVLLKH